MYRVASTNLLEAPSYLHAVRRRALLGRLAAAHEEGFVKVFRMTLCFALTVCLAAAVFAMPQFKKEIIESYGLKPGSAIEKAGCSACHVGSTAKLNPYGVDLKAAMAAAKSKVLTAAIVKKTDALDSDKDGVQNGVEIKAGTGPGDPQSKPIKKK